jgi:hypothetical protein
VSPDLREEVLLELSQLHELIGRYHPLLERAANDDVGEVETLALAAVLHSFYTGIENICKRLVIGLDGTMPQGESWHRDLLKVLALPTGTRPAVFSSDLHRRLKPYLDFRHVFRQAYGFRLHWSKMRPLVLACEEVLAELESELEAHFERNKFDEPGDGV